MFEGDFFIQNGFVKITKLITSDQLKMCANIYEQAFENSEISKQYRHDLGNHVEQERPNIENMTQVIWPSLYYV